MRRFGALAAVALAAVAVACSGMEEPAAPVEVEATVSPTQIAPVAPTPAAVATTAPVPTEGYDSTRNMFLLNSDGEFDPINSHEAVRLAVANNDKSMVPVMIEMLRFFGTWALVTETQDALTAITGHEVNSYSRGWFEWMEWLGKNADEYRPPDRYVEWKIDLMTPISYRFEEFLAPAANGSRINVFEIAWGGVRPDGIPPLEQAPVVTADKQDYMLPSDRVFGVSINGAHRAYPLRIVNAHEMANDILGGEPIALAY